MKNSKGHSIVKIFLLLFCILNTIAASVNVNYKTIQLSYIQTDRAAAVLKSLGFNVVDYTTDQGPTPYESIFTPEGNFDNNLINGSLEDADDLPIIIMLPETENVTLLDSYDIRFIKLRDIDHFLMRFLCHLI